MAKPVRARKAEQTTARDSVLDVAIVALAASIAGIVNDFANDDLELIARNGRVHDLTHVREWFTLPYWPPPFSPDLYRPLTTMLHAIEWTIGGGTPIVFRIVSYLLYIIACSGVFLLATRFLSRRVAFGAAALFAAHPVHVEAVALGIGQAELASTICVIGMCLLYCDRRRAGALATRDWVTLALLYLVASLFKEQGLVTPLLLGAMELTLLPGSTEHRTTAARGVLWFAPVAVTTLVLRHNALGGFAGTFKAEAFEGIGVGGRWLTMLAMVPRWLRLLLWPQHLQYDYSPQEIVASASFGVREAGGLLLLVVIIGLAWRLWRRAPVFAFGVAWCAIALFPVSNVLVVTGIALAERTLFSPSVGAVLAVGGLAELALERFATDPRVARALGIATAALVLLGVARSIERQRVWRSDPFVVARTIKDAPLSFRNQRAFGELMFGLDQPKLGHDAFAKAIRYSPAPTVWRVRNSYARALVRRGDILGAAEQFRQSLTQRPDQEYERGEYVVVLLALGRYSEAAAQADTGAAHAGRPEVYREMRAIADSAARVGAPAGAIRMGLVRGNVRADR